MDQIVMAAVLGDCAISILSVRVKHLGSGFTSWKRIVSSPLPTGIHKTEQPWHVTYGEDWTMIKGEESFQLGKPWRHAPVFILSHPEPSQALNLSFPLAPQLHIHSTIPFPNISPNVWNKRDVSFIAEEIICISSSNEAISELENWVDFIYWAEKGKGRNLTAHFCVLPCCCSSISVQFKVQYPTKNTFVAFAVK